jgi:cell division topological specificity factor
MLDFLKSLFKPQGSGATAKERLRLVLLSDHLALAPETIEALKADLFDVFSRYFEYDAKQAEVTFDHREREVAMLASVPILRVRERPAMAEVRAEAPPPALLEPETVPLAPLVPAAPRPRKRRRKRNAAAANGQANGVSPGLSASHSAQA